MCANATISKCASIHALSSLLIILFSGKLPRCLTRYEYSCVRRFDLMDCSNAFDFCSKQLIEPYLRLSKSLKALTTNFTLINVSWWRAERVWCQYDLWRGLLSSTKVSVRHSSFSRVYYDVYSQLYRFTFRYYEHYLNRKDVRNLLGIDESFGNFSALSPGLNTAFWSTGDGFHQNQIYIAELLERDIRVLIYVGEFDFSCNWIGNEQCTLEMVWSGRDGYVAAPLRDWRLDGRVVGRTRAYGGLTFATIRQAGHLVRIDFCFLKFYFYQSYVRLRTISLKRHLRW